MPIGQLKGVISLPRNSMTPSALVEVLRNAFTAAGSPRVSTSTNAISFEGITNYRTVSPLVNIVDGTVVFEFYPSSIDLTYTFLVDRKPFLVGGVLAIIGFSLMAFGYNQLKVFAFFGAGIFIVSFGLTFLQKNKFHRWLKNSVMNSFRSS
jgi:hypothetical protein